ncbi:MAG: insulinase family protein [Candidatus Sumerlaeaceae bacterium]|nr:insulinase family protein [Candidatus Sumerlaeaceae bacterium]
MENIKKIVLPNGARILLERIPYVRSASVGLWIDVGSRNETPVENGLSHFIEHMFFKGTRTKNAFQLSNEMNAVGGNVNAFTTQENICLNAKVVDDHLSRAIDLISELYLDSTFDTAEIERERNVVLEEVKMYYDTPDEQVIDTFLDNLFADHPLGRPVLGTPERITDFKQGDIKRYLNREFAPDRIIISIAGNFDMRRIEPQLRRILEPIEPNGWERNPVIHPTPSYRSHNEDRRLEQVHFCMGTDAPPRTSDERFAFSMLNTILGGGTSSRIFQEVREKQGLAYSIGSFDFTFKDAGCFAISGGSSPRNIQKVLNICLEEVKKLYTELVSEEELESAREQIKSNIILGMENSASRMSRMAESEIYFGEHIPVDTVIERINAVTREDVFEMAQRYLKDRPITFASIGPEKKFEPYLNGITF